MSTTEQYTTERHPLGQPGDGADRLAGRRSGGIVAGRGGHKPFFLTSEFLVLIGLIVAIMIAAAVARNFHAPRAWTLAAVLGAAYIVSRGISKIGRGDGPLM